MKPIPFAGLVFLALLFAALTAAETWQYRGLEAVLREQRQLQARVSVAQVRNNFTDQLIHRLAYLSLRDRAIADVLRVHGIKANLPPADSDTNAPASNSTSPSQPVIAPMP